MLNHIVFVLLGPNYHAHLHTLRTVQGHMYPEAFKRQTTNREANYYICIVNCYHLVPIFYGSSMKNVSTRAAKLALKNLEK